MCNIIPPEQSNAYINQEQPDTIINQISPEADTWPASITHPAQVNELQPNAIKHDIPPIIYPMKDKTTTSIMRRAMMTPMPTTVNYCLHIDRGANMSITDDASLLLNFHNIKKFPISGVSDNGPALYATGLGYLPWKSTSHNETILVRCFYSPDAAETIISPTDIVINRYTDYCA